MEQKIRRVRRTKIVATVGPASSSEALLRELLERGVNVFRLNFSHGTRDDHAQVVTTVRKLENAIGRPVGILQDVQGPKIRVGKSLDKAGIELKPGATFRLTIDDSPGTHERIGFTYPELMRDLSVNQRILINDGLIELRATKILSDEIITTVVVGGRLTDNKGINLPDCELALGAMTEKDKIDLEVGAELGIDWVALSFVRSSDDIRHARELLRQKGSNAKVMAKIERYSAVLRFEEILTEADGIMVARGDLGVEMRPEIVPIIQKKIIRLCNDAGKPVVTATQMLESMIQAPTPTRAEASDVANAIFDGTDAVMLSAETATGQYPAKAVDMMDRIARQVEESPEYENRFYRFDTVEAKQTSQDAVCHSASRIAHALPANVVASFTSTGSTAWRMARYRPRAPTVALTPFENVARQLSIGWGIIALIAPDPTSSDHLSQEAISILQRSRMVQARDVVVITAGVPFGQSGTTNMLRVEQVGF